MIDINEYILRPLTDRQGHLKLDEDCVLRGGNSENSRGLLAHILDTSIPKGQKIHLCHACHNGLCGNPNHLYWGTSKENTADRIRNRGYKSPWEYTVDKYGLEAAKRMNSKPGNTFGSGNKGKPKSEEHKANIAANRKGGRKKNAGVTELA